MDVSEYISSIRYKNSIQPICIGDSVRITQFGAQSYGLVGEVVGFENHLVLVKFSDWFGETDKILRFLGSSMKRIYGISSRPSNNNSESEEKKEMANNAVTGNYDIAWTKFMGAGPFDKEYAFALFDPEIRAGDHVLVEAAGEYKVVKVSSIVGRAVYNGTAPTKEVVCKVDFSEYERRKKIREQKKILRKQMDELVSKNQELILYQAIAKDNPEMAAMLEEYKALGDEV